MALWDAINNTNWVDVEKIAKLNIFEKEIHLLPQHSQRHYFFLS